MERETHAGNDLLEGDPRWLRAIAQIMVQHELSEVSVEQRGCKVRVRRGTPVTVSAAPLGAAAAAAPAVPAAPAAGGAAAAPGREEGVVEITSPMVGTFYRAPAPDADPFVEVGDRVSPDTVVCIIEAMKVMNEIRAEVAGTVEAILVANGEAVEFGQPLMRIRTGE